MKTAAQLNNVYERLPVSCSLSYTTVLECLLRMGAAPLYHIHCGRTAFVDTKALMQLEWQNKSPFCPPVNYSQDRNLEDREWYITAHGNGTNDSKAVGSEGA